MPFSCLRVTILLSHPLTLCYVAQGINDSTFLLL
ncbi:hypothetical protein GYH30_039564 [Glycine max]|nr:hypothetical protein GYH30_039564 [Glycine max]